MKKDFENVFLFFKHLNPIREKIEYVAGIPNLNKNFLVEIQPDAESLNFIDFSTKKKMIQINRKDILNIYVEDDTTIESRVGIKRMLLVGIFAFAWKKRKKNPLGFLVIEYKDDISGAEKAIFQSTTKDAFQILNNIKYNLLSYWKYSDESGENYNEQINKFENTHNAEVEKETENVKNGCVIGLIIIAVLVVLYLILT